MTNMTLHVKGSICMTAEFGASPKYIDIKGKIDLVRARPHICSTLQRRNLRK
jgi:hypothetical protein